MIKVQDVMNKLEELAPFSLTPKGDNSGLLVGDLDSSVTKIMVCLDITNRVVKQAVEDGYELIVSHHPVIFNPLYTLSNENPAVLAVSNGISCICSHLPLDLSENGINKMIFNLLEQNVCKMDIVSKISDFECGYICDLSIPQNCNDLAEKLKQIFGCHTVRYNATDKPIERIAFCSGAGGSMLNDVLLKGATAYITGDVKHDQFITAQNSAITIFDCGHYHTEAIVVNKIVDTLATIRGISVVGNCSDPCSYV